jgi:hypothetical protein
MTLEQEVSKLADYEVDDLLIMLAEQTIMGGSPLDPNHKRNIGRALLRGWFAKVKDVLCAPEGLSRSARDKESEIRDAAAVADTISATLGQQVPVVTLSILIVKYGLDKLCAGE